MILAIIKQELRLAFKKLSDLFNPLIFFFIAISIFAISFENLLSQTTALDLGVSIIWLCLTFSILLGTQNSFKEDFDDGTMEQLFISGNFFELIIATKILSGWLIHCLPLIIFIPIATIFLKLNNSAIINLMLISILISLIISLIANFCASLILSTSSNNSLLTILVLPLIVPAIIFAGGAFNGMDDKAFFNAVKFLSALLIFLAPILIFATTAAIKLNIRE